MWWLEILFKIFNGQNVNSSLKYKQGILTDSEVGLWGTKGNTTSPFS